MKIKVATRGIKMFYGAILLLVISNLNVTGQTFYYNSAKQVARITYQGLSIEYKYDDVGNRISQTVLADFCPNSTISYKSILPGNKFQWQVKIDSTSSFTPIADNNIYFGTRIDSLIIMNPSTVMVGYKYRCAVTLDGETNYSPEYELRIRAIWKGGADSSWSNPSNWECGLVPAEKIDVIIPKGMSSPVLSQDAKVESVLLKDGEVLKLAPGVKLEITGKRKE